MKLLAVFYAAKAAYVPLKYQIENSVNSRYNPTAALLHTGNRKEVCGLEILTSYLVSLAAGIVGCYVYKWLERHRKGK